MAMPRDGKHPLPLAGRKSPRSKRTRSVYFVESPGGTWRKMSPTKLYRETGKLSDMQPVPDSGQANGDGPLTPDDDETEDDEPQEDDELKGLSVKDKLLKGMAIGHRRSDRYRATLADRVAVDPQLQLLGPPQDITTTAGMQKSVQRAHHVDPRLEVGCSEDEAGQKHEFYKHTSQTRV